MSTPVSFTVTEGLTLYGDRLRGERWQERPEILMLHGGGQTRHSWKATGGHLAARGFSVTSIDTRGHGDSDRSPSGDYELQTLAADVLAVVARIDRPVIVVGASVGGLTAVVATSLAEPGRIAALVLVDIVPDYEESGSDRVRAFMLSGIRGFTSLDEAADAVAAYLPHRPRPANHAGLLRNLRSHEDGRWYWHWDPRLVLRDIDFDARLTLLEASARTISVPVMLVRGLLSDIVDEEGVEHLKSLVPQLEVRSLSSAAHTAAGDDNDAFSTAVVDFVLQHQS